jgi:hypothetical protein
MMILFALGLIWLLLVGWLWRRSTAGGSSATLQWDLLAGGLLFLLTLGFFWRTLSGEVYQPADGGDLVSFLFPTYRFAARQLSQGVLPLWNPHLYGGAPLIGDIQAGWLYLPNLLLFWVAPDFAYGALQWLAVGHIYWAGLGVYVLLCTLRWGEGQPLLRPAALFGALAFQFSDPLLIHLGNLNLIAVLSWLPWVLAAYSRALSEQNLRWAGLAGLLFALGNYAGHAQSSFYLGLALGIYTLFEIAIEVGKWRPVRFGLQALAATLLVAALLTAPILLPALELVGYTARSDFAYQESVNFSLAPTQAIGLLTPGFFGHGPALHWSLWQRVETPFAGVAALILAGAALILAEPGQRRRLMPWLGLAIFGFVTALGVYALLHGWLTLLAPGFGQLRAPARALVLWTLGVAVLAAVGVDQLSRASTNLLAAIHSSQVGLLNGLLRWGALILAGIFTPLLYLALLLTQQDPTAFLRASVAALAITLATGCWLATWALLAARWAGWLDGRLFAGLLIALLYFDLAAAGAYTDISPSDPTQGYRHPEIIAFLQGDPAHFRIDTDTEIGALWQPDTAALVGLEDIGGVANPLTLRGWTELLAATGGRGSRLYDLLNVKYVIARDHTTLPEGKFELALDAPGELAIYRNRTPLPRAWLVHEALIQADHLPALRDPTFDPLQAVVLSNPVAEAISPAIGPETVNLLAADVNQLEVQVQATSPGYLVLSEVWHPGWLATVNGTRTPVLRANHALRAIFVPAGESTVMLVYTPRSWWIGLGGLAVGLVALIGLIMLGKPVARQADLMVDGM